MPVIRTEKTENFTIMANHHLRDMQLSLKARGLLSLMLSLPDDWDYSARGLACLCQDGVSSICSALKELEQAGYVVRSQRRNSRGTIVNTEYVIYEMPHHAAPSAENPHVENPHVDCPHVDRPRVENRTQLNKDKQKKDKPKKEKQRKDQPIPPNPPRGPDGTGTRLP